MFFILAAPGMYAAPQTQETDKKALREQRREERRQKREERREERQQRKKEQKTPQSPVSVPPTNPAPETIHEEIETPREPTIISKQKETKPQPAPIKIKRILHLRKSYNHPNKPYLQLCSRLKLHILIQNQKKGIQYYGFYSSLDYLYF